MQVNILLPLSCFSQEVLPRYHASRLQMSHLSKRYKTEAWQPRFVNYAEKAGPLLSEPHPLQCLLSDFVSWRLVFMTLTSNHLPAYSSIRLSIKHRVTLSLHRSH